LRADEGEDDEDPACRCVAADEVARPVLYVYVHGGLDTILRRLHGATSNRGTRVRIRHADNDASEHSKYVNI
jgi:hypothetical protein